MVSLYAQACALQAVPHMDLDNIFRHHPPKNDQVTRYESLRAGGKQLAQLIMASAPSSSERDRAIHKIEEAIMLANAAIARNE